MSEQRVPNLEELNEQQVRLYLVGSTNPKLATLAGAVLMYSAEHFCDNLYITWLV